MKIGRKRCRSGTVWKLVECTFATIIVVACCFSIIWTTLNTKRSQPRMANSNALMLANLNFKSAMREQNNKEIDDQQFDTPVPFIVDKNSDTSKLWFRKKEIKKYVPTIKHPYLKAPVIINKNICNDSTVHFLVFCQSFWNNFDKRQELRDTWAHRNVFKDLTIRRLFIIGKPTKKEDQQKIDLENSRNMDILQGDFLDSFANLTLKSILAVQWINDYCIHANYIVKTDDDIFVNMYALVEYLVVQIFEKQKAIMCQLKENNTSPIIRQPPTHKWYVPNTIFPGRSYYPKFCNGYMVLMSTDLIPELYSESFTAPYFSVDDAYLFGLILGKVKNVVYEDITNALTLNQKEGLKEYESNGPIQHVAVASWEKGVMKKLWAFTLSNKTAWGKLHEFENGSQNKSN